MPPSEATKDPVGRPQSTHRPVNGAAGLPYLLVIGIDRYQNCPALYNCVKDGKRLIRILSQQYSFPAEHISTLFDEEATEGNIFREFRRLAQLITPQDDLVIYFSGHGQFDEVFDEGYWVPVDARLGALETYIANSEIKKILSVIKSRHTFLIADSCFSGSLFANYKSSDLPERLSTTPSRWGLTAGRNEVVSDGQAGDHSPFANSLFYQLENSNKPLGVARLCNLVVESVVASEHQTPRGEPLRVAGHKGGQFFFIPRSEHQKPAGTLQKKGRLLYQIPERMEVRENTRCMVRIAFDKETLVRELEKTTENKVIKPVRISDIMEVDLIDPSANQHFQIHAVNQLQQLVDKDDFTQWLFYVRPLQAGTFPLLLKVTIVEILHQKERRKDIVLEETVEVVTELKEVPAAPIRSAGYALEVMEAEPAAPTKSTGGITTTKLEKIERPDIPVSPSEPSSFSTERKSRNWYGLIGGIAAGLLAVVIAWNTFIFSDNKESGISKSNQKNIDSLDKLPIEEIPEINPDIPADNKKPNTKPGRKAVKWKRNNQTGLFCGVDQYGEVVIPCEFDLTTAFKKEAAFVRKKDVWALIQSDGEYLIPFIINQPGRFGNNGFAKIQIKGRNFKVNTRGEIDRNGRMIRLTDWIEKQRSN